jgi:hypothetical protein
MQGCNDIAMALLCGLLEQPQRTLHADGLRLSEYADAYRHLLDIGALVSGNELESSVLCPSCSEHSLTPVADSAGGYRAYCFDCGWIPLVPRDVKPLSVVPGQIARWLTAALGLAGRFRCEPVIDGVLWRLGELEHRRKRRTVFFGSRLIEQAAAVKTHVDRLAAPGAEVILTTADPTAMADGPLGDFLLIPLRAVVHLRKAGFVLENLDAYLDRTLRPGGGNETSLRLLSRRIALIEGESHPLSPQVCQFLSLLDKAGGEPLHKRAIADALEMNVDAFKAATMFKRHKPVYDVFVAGDHNGRY